MKTSARSNGAKRAHMTHRILRLWADVTAEDVIAGREWYARAQMWAREQGDMQRAAGVLAALSPRCAWSTNQRWARTMLTAAVQGDVCPEVHTTAMRAQAWRIANGEHPLAVLNGPKVRAFYANIMGDTDVVTVDVWAARIARGTLDRPAVDADSRITKAEYLMVAQAFRIAAGIAGVAPSTMQAACWVHVRGAAE